MSTGKMIVRNASWLLIATTVQKVIAFVAFTVAARLVGPAIIGTYFYAVAITSTFVVFADFGLTQVVIRAVAADERKGRAFAVATLRLKLLFIPFAALLALGFGLWRGISGETLLTLLIMLFVMSADSIHLLFYGTLRGRQKLGYEAIGMLIGQTLTAIAAVSAAMLGWGAPGLAMALLLGSTWHVGWSWMQSNAHVGLNAKPTSADVRGAMRQALPFALAGVFVKVYSYLDTIMIQAFQGAQAVGNYAAAYKVTYAFQFIPVVFVAALYPAMSSMYANEDKEQLRSALGGSLRLMALVCVPIAAGLSAIAPRLIPAFFSRSFLGAVPALSILPWALVPIFLDYPIGSLLNASHRAHLKTISLGATMLVNAVLNILLIPTYGPVGAAWSSIFSYAFLFAAGAFFVWKDMPSTGWFFSLLTRSVLAAAVIWIVIRQAGPAIPFVLSLFFDAAFSVCILLIMRLLTIQDLKTGIAWLRKRVSPDDPQEDELHESP
jgi:O-antigen/teichoic acid export membrane protein